MRRFYLTLWGAWVLRVLFCTLVSALVMAFVITLVIYVKQGFVALDDKVLKALFEIGKFWFSITLNLALLFALFRSVKYLFNHCYAGYMLKLKTCTKEESLEFIESVGYGDLVKIWRKWFMTLIWLTGALMVLALVFTHLFTHYESLFSWFSVTTLYLFIALSGYFSIVLIVAKMKTIKVVKC